VNWANWANISFANWYYLFGLFAPLSILILVSNVFIKIFISAGSLMLAAAIVLWAGPRRLGVPQTERELTNIEFCLDLSGSMTASFGEGSRYDAAMIAINDFVDLRKGDAFGLTIFSSRAGHWIPLTNWTWLDNLSRSFEYAQRRRSDDYPRVRWAEC